MITEFEIAFSQIKGMNTELAQKILEIIPSEKDFFLEPEKNLIAIFGKKNKILDSAYRKSILEKSCNELEFITKNNISTLYYTDTSFPSRLYEAADAPILIYGKGNSNLNAHKIISIVGTRHATQYGKHETERLVADIAMSIPDCVIVSGLAYGIDICAHRAAIANKLPTIAILAHGLNTMYPAQHRNSAIEIIKQGGMLITEYTSQDTIHRANFLARNRIVAAIADCTVVIESAEKGGALVTASIANSYNRDVFALPGKVSDEYSKGCNDLIRKNKAALFTNANDIFNAMNWGVQKHGPIEKSLFIELSTEEQKIVDLLTMNGESHINNMASALGIPIHKLLSLLVDMEFNGHIKSLPGGKYTI